MLNAEEFDRNLRQWLSEVHFVPFFVELADGRQILIREPVVAFGGGTAAFIDSEEQTLVEFSHEQVIGFHAAGHEVGA